MSHTLRSVMSWVAAGGILAGATRAVGAQQAHDSVPRYSGTALLALFDDTMRARDAGTAERFIVESLRDAFADRKRAADLVTVQRVPLRKWELDDGARIVVTSAPPGFQAFLDGKYIVGRDFVPIAGSRAPDFARSAIVENRQVVFGGRLGEPGRIAARDAAGKVVVLLPAMRDGGVPDYQVWTRASELIAYKDAAAVLIPVLELIPPSVQRSLVSEGPTLDSEVAPTSGPPVVATTRALASVLLNTWAEGAIAGHTAHFNASVRFSLKSTRPAPPTHNVVLLLEGSDARLKSELVVVSSHLDAGGAEPPDARRTPEFDRLDSVYNASNEGSSGAVAALAIAREMIQRGAHPKRSVLFLWTTAETEGSLGAQWFVGHQSPSSANIALTINVGPVGSLRSTTSMPPPAIALQPVATGDLSSSLMSLFVDAGVRAAPALHLEQRLDATAAPRLAFCSGAHWVFARAGYPSVFWTTAPVREARLDDGAGEIDYSTFAAVASVLDAFIEGVADSALARPASASSRGARMTCPS